MNLLYGTSDLGIDDRAMFTVTLNLETDKGTFPYRMQATSDRHLEEIRRVARLEAPAGSVLEIRAERNW
jgi:hypothetical protein